MSRIFISKKAVLSRFDDILKRYPGLDSYTGYLKLIREIKKFRDDIENDDESLKPEVIELKKNDI